MAAMSPEKSSELAVWCRATIFLLLAVAPGSANPAYAYAGDSHYYLRFAFALEACFDWDEAHLIASADYLVDKNQTTTAEKHPFKKYNKIHWHAFGRNEERFNTLWERTLSEQDEELQLVKLGQFLHYISDWESHYGYGVRFGHGISTVVGRDPDSLGANYMNNLRMIEQTIDHMFGVCLARGRDPWQGGDPDLFRSNLYKSLATEPILKELFDYNSKKWKSWGVRGKKGKAILARNHLLIEQLIERRSKGIPERNVPADFTPGDPDRGLPPPIGLRYDKDGNLLEVYGVEIELLPEYQGDPYGAEEEDALEESLETDLVDDLEHELGQEDDSDIDSNLELQVLDADLKEDGWLITVRVENLGGGTSPVGQLELVVMDVTSEELLAEASRPVPSLEGRETFQNDIMVRSEDEPTREVLIGASLDVPELSADNNQAWYVPWRAAIKADEGKKKTKKGKSDLRVELLGTPKVWIDESGTGAWVVLRALVAGGHSSRRLELLEMAIGGGENATPVRVNDGLPVVWLSIPDLKRRVVPAEALSWFRFDAELCASIERESTAPTDLQITLRGKELRTMTRSYPLDADFLAAFGTACAAVP